MNKIIFFLVVLAMSTKPIPLVLTGSIIDFFVNSCKLPNEIFKMILQEVNDNYLQEICWYVIKIQVEFRLHLKRQLKKNTEFYIKKRRSTSKEDALSIFNNCIACTCCKRHQINKPKTPIKWIKLPFDNQEKINIYKQNNIKYNCSCNCRHLSRMICSEIF